MGHRSERGATPDIAADVWLQERSAASVPAYCASERGSARAATAAPTVIGLLLHMPNHPLTCETLGAIKPAESA
jgi:hypothetical protein